MLFLIFVVVVVVVVVVIIYFLQQQIILEKYSSFFSHTEPDFALYSIFNVFNFLCEKKKKKKYDEVNYNAFKQAISDVANLCFGLVFKFKRVVFNSYFGFVTHQLQVNMPSQPFQHENVLNDKLVFGFWAV